MQLFNILLLVFGFGFVIFWHELGHFLAAKWAGVKVEQFAVGFGQALISYRKGLGIRFGTSGPEYQKRAAAALEAEGGNPAGASVMKLDAAAAKEGLSPTEYRLNWLPLGGYVKMLGQDDLRPSGEIEDPRSFNRASVPKRMVIISAGVIMNVILAAAAFWALFTVGFNTPPSVVGNMTINSPAQLAGLQIGDEIVSFDGDRMHDFNKIALAVPLSAADEPVPMVIRRNGEEETLEVRPRTSAAMQQLPALGVGPTVRLQLPEGEIDEAAAGANHPQNVVIRPGETVVAVEGQPVELDDYPVLYQALQDGEPVTVTVETADGTQRDVTLEPVFAPSFGTVTDIGGMLPRVQIDGFADPDSPVAQKLQVGDVVVAGLVTGKTDRLNNPSSEAFRNFVDAAGKAEQTVDLTVLRDGELVEANALPLKELVNDRFGLGVTIREDSTAPLVAAVAPDSPAAALGVRPGTTVTAINGTAVADWYEIDQAFKRLTDGDELAIEFDDGTTTTLALTAATADRLGRNLYDTRAAQFMQRRLDTRQADNVVQALWWGVEETRYLILKFYLTLRRIATGDVPPSLLNGPVGIIDVGTRIATTQNTDYMIWFLAMISANLAVVNFLPLPIVDGGLFCFLLYEAVRGKPPSPKVQYYTQIVGLLLIGSIFLFVTFNDLGRLGLF